MIPRYQRVLFWCLSGVILLMALFMLRGCTQVREKFTRHTDQTPLDAPVATPTETVHLAMADDSTGVITMQERSLALPEEQTSRARALLGRLMAEYTYKGSKHPLESGRRWMTCFLWVCRCVRQAVLTVTPAVPARRAGCLRWSIFVGRLRIITLRGSRWKASRSSRSRGRCMPTFRGWSRCGSWWMVSRGTR